MVWMIVGAGEPLAILWLLIETLRAPIGYQDESGFHQVPDIPVHQKSKRKMQRKVS
ncbi:MAG TPA: hypothetical protein VLX91_15470 [Candidatus Acidoferrales bacterium]|nr:hypothetical protein [Candidatus Acidoferrales bacterium]